MISPVNGVTQSYLDSLDRIQSTLDSVTQQVSSGIRVGQPSDDPSAVPGILDTLSQIAQDTQTKTNLNEVSNELSAGDNALQNAVTVLGQAISLGSEAASPQTPTQNADLLQQAQAVQQQLVDLSATTVNGRYIFSGDLDDQPLYALDASQPEGVKQLASATSTRTITDGAGATLWVPLTAQEIFDPKNADGSAATGNVFAAVNSLVQALQNNDQTAAGTAVDSLKAADDYLSQQLGFYGIAENRVADTLTSLGSSLATENQSLSNLRDADVAGDAIELTQVQTQQQAALSVGSKLSQLNLFSYLA
ncbi:MAG: flagellin [Bryobacteraceae bacterium]|jgi:flagellar hook-associated protein 3 FlgL